MLFGYSLLAKVPVLQVFRINRINQHCTLKMSSKIIHRDDNDQTFYVIVNLSIKFIWKTSIQV